MDMKEATDNFIKNASVVDKEITEEIWKDFLAQLVIFKTAQDRALLNYTITNITNTTQKTESLECAEYCTGDIRTIFEQYKLYHGYVALIVCCYFSTFQFIPYHFCYSLQTQNVAQNN